MLHQASLAAALGLSAAGVLAGLSSPNPYPEKAPSSGDSIRWLVNVMFKFGRLLYVPLGLAMLHHSSLVLSYPDVPAAPLLGHGAANGLNPDMLTWSRATALPIVLILCVGTPLRLVSYSGLGKNFTFALAKPDHLSTGGIYRYMQHPSYTGFAALVLGMAGLWGRLDGLPSCWLSPRVFSILRDFEPAVVTVGVSLMVHVIWTRVKQEETMLHTEFGTEWESWHSKTARFIPWIF
ncbi:hypothetical protein F5Y19DRAFT_458691 [Xylariaceae sp. FL1651]|nr:hypothetical protein F5Y19DRAFT_458691 [Xylariaceae sp. FL1651]